MAIALTKLTAGAGTTTPQNTASISPTNNAVVFVVVVLRANDSNFPSSYTTITSNTGLNVGTAGGGGAWERIVFSQMQGTAMYRQCHVWRAMSSSAGTGSIAIALSTVALLGWTWGVYEATGVVTTGTNGADAYSNLVVNYNSSGADISPDITITGTPTSGDVTLAILANEDSQVREPGESWTELDDTNGAETGHQVIYSTGQDQTVVWQDQADSGRDWATVGMILESDGSGASPTPLVASLEESLIYG